MRSLVPLLVFTFTITLINGEFLHGNHFAPNIVATRTIIGGAIGGAPSSGAFSAARYSQTIATPGTIHTIVSTHPIHHISSISPNNNHHDNNVGTNTRASGGDAAGHSTSNYDSHQTHEGISSNGGQSNQGYVQSSSNNNPSSNYY